MLKGYFITVCGVRVYHPLRSTLTGGQATREIAANAVFASTAAGDRLPLSPKANEEASAFVAKLGDVQLLLVLLSHQFTEREGIL